MQKNNEKQLLESNNYIAVLKEHIKKLDDIRSDDKKKFWAAVKSLCTKAIENNTQMEDAILGQNSLEHPGNVLGRVRFYKGGTAALKELISQIDNVDDVIGNWSAKIKEQEVISNEIKSNLELQGETHGD